MEDVGSLWRVLKLGDDFDCDINNICQGAVSCVVIFGLFWADRSQILAVWVQTFEWRPKCSEISVLRTFAPIVSAHPYCARLHAQIHMPRHASSARQVLKWTMIGHLAIAVALLGFNDLGRSVTPTFLFRNRFYLQLSPHCSRMNKKINVGSQKNFKISVHGTWNRAILRLQGAWNYGL